MSFSVDPALCRHCGCCASGCVCGLIRLPEAGVPYIEPFRQDSCVHCGHCIAVCPEGAIRLDGMSAGQLEEAGPPPVRSCGRPLAQGAAGHQEFQTGSP